MNVGELNTKIDFCTESAKEGPVKPLELAYDVKISSIWAKKTRLVGAESIKLGMEHNTVPVNFIVRARTDISEDMFIRHDNVIYNIVGFEELKSDKNFMLIATVIKQVIT